MKRRQMHGDVQAAIRAIERNQEEADALKRRLGELADRRGDYTVWPHEKFVAVCRGRNDAFNDSCVDIPWEDLPDIIDALCKMADYWPGAEGVVAEATEQSNTNSDGSPAEAE